MNMEKVTKQQIYHKLGSNFIIFFSIILVLVLVLFSFFFFLSVFESFLYLFTLLIAVLSTMFLVTLRNKKVENIVQDNMQISELQPSLEDVTQKQEQQVEAKSYSSFPLDSQSCNIIDKDDDDDEVEEEEEEDGLIEIKLPSSNFIGLIEDPKQKLETNLSDSIFKHHGFSDLLEEMNEDENLIEIDISKGYTKCEDFRFKELACLGDQCVVSD